MKRCECKYETGQHEAVMEQSYNKKNHYKKCSVDNCDIKESIETHEIVTKAISNKATQYPCNICDYILNIGDFKNDLTIKTKHTDDI